MGTFGRCQQPTSSSSAPHSRAFPARPRPHVEQEPFWAGIADPQAVLAGGNASTGFRHDFKRISVFSSSSGTIQAKLAVNAPGDRFEQGWGLGEAGGNDGCKGENKEKYPESVHGRGTLHFRLESFQRVRER